MRYLGIDYGRNKLGLALSDDAGTMGFPKSVVKNDARLMETMRTLIATEKVGAVVIGDSKDARGGENLIAQEARAFGATLAEESGVPVFYEMEAFTTQEAKRALDGTRDTSAVHVDASAAALILTSYLSRSHD